MNKSEDHFSRWKNREKIAESMIPLIGQLYREKNVTTTIYSRSLVNKSVLRILKDHRFVKHVEESVADTGLSVTSTYPVLQEVAKLDLGPCRVDIGWLTVAFNADDSGRSVVQFVADKLADATGNHDSTQPEGTDIVLYGFGRIGRLLTRLLVEKVGSGRGLRLRAIVVRKKGKHDLRKRAGLLRSDSVHGSFSGAIAIDEEDNAIIANGNFIKVIYADDPARIDYTQYGIDDAIVVDNTGKWRDEAGLAKHLEARGVSRVLLTAPGKDSIKNIVCGVNHDIIDDSDRILSAASCTTNAIVPALKAMDERFGIDYCHVETVHSYTNDQNLLDNIHQRDRRGRAAPLNLVLTETGAATAVAKALPNLAGKISGHSVRVPTPNVSMVILNLTMKQDMDLEELNEYLRWTSLHSPMQRQVDFISDRDAVSSDFVGARHACVIDAEATSVNGHHCVLYIWYDNEVGYSCQVLRILQHISNTEYPVFPKVMAEKEINK